MVQLRKVTIIKLVISQGNFCFHLILETYLTNGKSVMSQGKRMSNSIPSVLNIIEQNKAPFGWCKSYYWEYSKTGCSNFREQNYVCPYKLPYFYIAPHAPTENYKGTFAVRNYICTLSFGNHYYPLNHSYWCQW